MVLDSLKSIKKTIGIRQTLKAIETGIAKTVIIAKDADEKVVKSIKELCEKDLIEIVYVDNMKQLGKACGIEVGAAVVGTLE